jgi:hypothetical protein
LKGIIFSWWFLLSYGAARKLTSRQLNANLRRALKQSEGKRVVNSRVLKENLLKSSDERVLEEVVKHFVVMGEKGDVKIKLFLNRCASEKFNKNSNSRFKILVRFRELAKKGDSFGLKGLLVGVRDSNKHHREYALRGLSLLAAKGETRTLPGLLHGVKDSSEYNRGWALLGLRELSKKGEKGILPGLLVGVKDFSKYNRGIALSSLRELAERGSVEAKKALKELGEVI